MEIFRSKSRSSQQVQPASNQVAPGESGYAYEPREGGARTDGDGGRPLSSISVHLGFATAELAELDAQLAENAKGSGRIDIAAIRSRIAEIRASVDHVRAQVQVAKRQDAGGRAGEAPGAGLPPRNLDIRRLLDAILGELAGAFAGRGRLVKDFGEVPYVCVRESAMRSAFLHVLNNALTAISMGDPSRQEIRVTTRTDSRGRVVVQISDTGIGIHSDRLRGLFHPPSRAGGRVPGLVACSTIFADAGGDIEVESTPGKGTLFRMVLPPVRESQRSMIAAAPLRSSSGKIALDSASEHPVRDTASRLAKARPIQASARRGRILVVDDEPGASAAMLRALGLEHDLVVVTNARAALDRIASGDTFDLVFADVAMPDLWGRAFFDELAKLSSVDPDSVIFTTKGRLPADRASFPDRAANLTLQKPFDPEELAFIVRQRIR